MNDSFVDLDLIGQIPTENYKIASELLCGADLEQPHPTREEHGQERRLGGAAQPPTTYREPQPSPCRRSARRACAPRRLRVIPGLGERVIYRELFPEGLTLLDIKQIGEVGPGHITAELGLCG